ncbi:MAG: HDIG domain-containing protein [Anaerolineae bacterium]|nr:HDIG domain-containing protein [Anaerolineae bacterium]
MTRSIDLTRRRRAQEWMMRFTTPKVWRELNLSAHVVTAAVFVVVFTVLATAIVGYLAFDPNTNLDLAEGDVAPMDIRAPYDSSFESPILTDQKRQEVVNSVRNVYKTDNEVTRRQVNRARLVMDYIEHVRSDAFASLSQKQGDLDAIEGLTFDRAQPTTILMLSDADWKRVRDQVNLVLSSVLSGEVREENLQTIYDSVPRRSVLFPEEQEALITRLVSQLIKPNTFIDPEATESAREAQRTAVAPVVRSFREGQIVVDRGKVITNLDLEALNRLGLLTAKQNTGLELAAAFITVLLSEVIVALYLNRFHPRLLADLPGVIRLGVLFLCALVLARMMISLDGGGLGYLYPGAALAMLVAGLAGANLAILMTTILGLLAGIMAGSVEMAALVTAGGIVSVLYLRRTERVNAFFTAGTLAGVAHAGVILAFGLTNSAINPDVFALLTRIGLGLMNGVLSAAAALTVLFVLGSAFNVTTGLLLSELSRPDNPLLQRLMREAPGTYQHSLMVANLGEAAAEVVGANMLLVRVGALYHDIGKMYNPTMFAENHAYGDKNVHAGLSPRESAQAIIRHVVEGEKMARKARLPVLVRNFILEHHGTTKPAIFWHQAVEEAGGDESALDPADFSYPGPKPQSRETAIVMIADGCESAMRAVRPSGEEEITALVNKIISHKMSAEQFDECDLTLHDLDLVRDTIVSSLKGVFHPRPQYPDDETAQAPEAARLPAATAAPAAPAAPAALSAGANRASPSDQKHPAAQPARAPAPSVPNVSPAATQKPKPKEPKEAPALDDRAGDGAPDAKVRPAGSV